MLGISLAMLVGSALLMLRLSPGGSFPSPLSQEEEKNISRSGKMEISPLATSLLSTISALLLTSLKILYADKRYRRPYIYRNYRAYKGDKYL